MKSIFKYITLSLMLLTLIACNSASTLTYTQSQLQLKVEDYKLNIQGKEIQKTSQNHSIVFIDQKLLKLNDGSLVVYEYAQTDMAYEFAFTTRRNISIIFDAIDITEVYNHHLVYAYQMRLRSGQILNILVSQSYDQEISMVYGMNNTRFIKMLQGLNSQIRTLPYQNIPLLQEGSQAFISNWTTYKINFVPLVQPLPRFMRM
jgi:hypothetical protein